MRKPKRETEKMEEKVILEMENISKRFIKVQALKGVDFKVHQKEIIGLVGSNGAGKSTLVNIIAGVYKPTSGKIIWEGEELKFYSPKDSQKKGIKIVYQEPALIPNMTAIENIFLGEEIYKNMLLLDKKAMKKKAKEIFTQLEIDINLEKPINDMNMTQATAVAIAKTLIKKPRLLILDEVTSA